MPLDAEGINRYARHLSLSEIGEVGQEKLSGARVLIVGSGGLGCPAALYLAAAGVGTLGLIDPDRVDETNLQRQILYRTADAGMLKVEMAQTQLGALNPRVNIQIYPIALDVSNAVEIIQTYDIVLDATDNFETRYLVNDACFFLKKPNVFASVTRFEGRLSVFCADGPCYRCLFPAPPEELILNCATEGILGAVPGVIGTLQALETIKLILDIGNSLKGKLVLFDMLTMQFRQVSIDRNPDCPLCGLRANIKTLESVVPICTLAPEISALELSNLLEQGTETCLVDVRETTEYQCGTISGARSIPLRMILEDRISLPKDQFVVLFCKSGQRSQQAAQTLLKRGFTSILSLSGGLRSWPSALTFQ